MTFPSRPTALAARAAMASLALAAALPASAASAADATFDELPLAPESHYAPGRSGNGETDVNHPFTSGAATFSHYFTDWGFDNCCQQGFTYSNHTDSVTPGYLNQYSAITGRGQGGSANYVIAYAFDPTVAAISFAAPTRLDSVYITNTTYATMSMRYGDGFAKPFGGASGNDPDFYKLTITGYDGAAVTASLDLYLADYRFADNSLDYILTDWTRFDLSALGAVTGLGFSVISSDVGQWGMNTPAYFALDTLAVAAVPEPVPLALWLAGLAAVTGVVRRRAARA